MFLILVICIWLNFGLFSQSISTHLLSPSGGSVATDYWNIQIDNHQKEVLVYLMGKIKITNG